MKGFKILALVCLVTKCAAEIPSPGIVESFAEPPVQAILDDDGQLAAVQRGPVALKVRVVDGQLEIDAVSRSKSEANAFVRDAAGVVHLICVRQRQQASRAWTGVAYARSSVVSVDRPLKTHSVNDEVD